MNAQLYINDVLMDLAPNTSIGVTFQVNDIAELKDRKANHTNQFSLPKTANNCEALGFGNLIGSSSRIPYRKLPAKYINDGIEIVSSGVAIVEASEKEFNVTVYSGNYDFFALIENLKLNDIDLSEYDHDWNLSTIISTVANDESNGFTYAIVDYSGSTVWFNLPLTGGIRPEMLFPSVFVKKILEKIAIEAGYAMGGSFLDRDSTSEPGVGRRLIIPFCGEALNHSQKWIDERTVKAETTSIQTCPQSADIVVQFENEISDPSGFGSDVAAQGYQLFPTGINNEASWHVRLVINLDNSLSPAYFRVDLEVWNGSTWNAGGTFESIVSGITQLVFDTRNISGWSGIQLLPGFKLRLRIVAGSGTGSVDFLPGTTVEFIPSKQSYFGNTIQLGSGLPAMSQKEFIKSLCNQFCLIPVADGLTRTIKLNKFDDVYKNKAIARDWSGKLDVSSPENISFRYGRIGQTNNLFYKEDPNVTKGLGDGSFTVDDEVIEKSVDIDTIGFAATEMKTYTDGGNPLPISVPFVKVYNETGDPLVVQYYPRGEAVSVQPRILLHHYYYDPDGFIHFVDALGLLLNRPFKASLAWFIDEGGKIPSRPISNNLGFNDNLIEKYYSGLRSMLDRFKKVTAQFKLEPDDVQNFDHMIPVWIEKFGEYFFVNKISNYQPGKLTQCELYRL